MEEKHLLSRVLGFTLSALLVTGNGSCRDCGQNAKRLPSRCERESFEELGMALVVESQLQPEAGSAGSARVAFFVVGKLCE